MRARWSVVVLLATSNALAAQDWIVGAGFADFSNGLAQDGGVALVEYHHKPIRDSSDFLLGLGGAFTVHGTGDLHLGVGLVGQLPLSNNWFVEGSVMPGVYLERHARNDLGSAFEIRSLIALGRRFANGSGISLALTHKSNASTAVHNPGVNAFLLRWHLPIRD
ncbi:acyloxyacyl hydrolase [Parasedimentitalea huanghaiensis]|uniref:Acyloxyacyl hydrolase n=1 Tax=Parasedimentitalea huanghaiensis TaxID=2682100 RepID=A0A6L6WMT1_9RHOB|nr:acyloxyacyl hydrolase [Zongyanglinia huanghaiensis]MVO18600.1 acyloxyacyl hydrolase [Zongyanglinia huanghaiensis]